MAIVKLFIITVCIVTAVNGVTFQSRRPTAQKGSGALTQNGQNFEDSNRFQQPQTNYPANTQPEPNYPNINQPPPSYPVTNQPQTSYLLTNRPPPSYPITNRPQPSYPINQLQPTYQVINQQPSYPTINQRFPTYTETHPENYNVYNQPYQNYNDYNQPYQKPSDFADPYQKPDFPLPLQKPYTVSNRGPSDNEIPQYYADVKNYVPKPGEKHTSKAYFYKTRYEVDSSGRKTIVGVTYHTIVNENGIIKEKTYEW